MIPLLERFTRNSYPGVFCAAVILLLTGLPGSLLPKVKPALGLDKVAHLLMYLAFAFCCLWGYRKPYRERGTTYRRKACLLTMAIGIGYGALTEVMQECLIPGRVGSVYDGLADLIGSLLGVALFVFFSQKGNKLKNESFRK